MTADDIIMTLPRRYRPAQKRSFTGTFHFVINGKRGGTFTVSVSPERCTVISGLQGKADCTVTTTDTVFIDIENGRVNPQVAFLMRKVRVTNVPIFLEFSKQFIPFYKWQKALQKMEVDAGTILPNLEGPLKDIQILDFSRLYPAPLATMWLAELGARVIKIELPRSPDPMRTYPPFIPSGESAGYIAVNRNKLSLAVDYTSAEGREVFFKLLRQSDVVVSSFRPERMAAMGIDYQTARNVKRDIIYVSLLGYPPQGIMAGKASHDLNYLALSGILESTGTPNQPVIPGVQLADVIGAYNVVVSILLALLTRTRHGEGGEYMVSMLQGALSAASLQLAQMPFKPAFVQRGKGILNGGMAAYNIYRTRDNKFVVLAAVEPKFWDAFCDAVNHPEWKGNDFLDEENQHQLIAEVAKVIEKHPRSYWERIAKEGDFCLTPVLSFEEVPRWFQENVVGLHLSTHQGIPHIPPPFVSRAKNNYPAPALGEHTRAILHMAGFSLEEIERLYHQNVVE